MFRGGRVQGDFLFERETIRNISQPNLFRFSTSLPKEYVDLRQSLIFFSLFECKIKENQQLHIIRHRICLCNMIHLFPIKHFHISSFDFIVESELGKTAEKLPPMGINEKPFIISGSSAGVWN